MAVVKARAKHLGVGLVDRRFSGEFFAEHAVGILKRTVEKPAEQTECEDIAAFEHRFDIHAGVGQRGFGH